MLITAVLITFQNVKKRKAENYLPCDVIRMSEMVGIDCGKNERDFLVFKV
jgi:hypothetical protein